MRREPLVIRPWLLPLLILLLIVPAVAGFALGGPPLGLAIGAIEVAARLTSIATVGASFRVAPDPVADRLARSITLQLALKTVY